MSVTIYPIETSIPRPSRKRISSNRVPHFYAINKILAQRREKEKVILRGFCATEAKINRD